MYTLLIVFEFRDPVVIHEVTNFGHLVDHDLFFFDKGRKRSFIPNRNVVYFGQEESWPEVLVNEG